MANVSVNFDTLKENHPDHKTIKSLIGNPLKASVIAGNWETCAIQVSYALNRSGAVIENYAFPEPTLYKGKVKALKSNDNMNYIYGVPDMKVFLNGRYGIAENYTGNKQSMISQISGRQGIIGFGHRHIDLWEGERFHWQHLYLDLWQFDSVKKRGIFFWEVTSELGF